MNLEDASLALLSIACDGSWAIVGFGASVDMLLIVDLTSSFESVVSVALFAESSSFLVAVSSSMMIILSRYGCREII